MLLRKTTLACKNRAILFKTSKTSLFQAPELLSIIRDPRVIKSKCISNNCTDSEQVTIVVIEFYITLVFTVIWKERLENSYK